MAFTILSSSGNLLNLSNSSTDSLISMSYSIDETKKFIYCNYPEALTTNMFGEADENNACLNSVQVTAGTHQLFFSYQYNDSKVTNTAIPPFKFGIQFFNLDSVNSMQLTILKRGDGTNHSSDMGSWLGVAGETVKNYFSYSADAPISIDKSGSYWIEKELPVYSGLYSGLIEFSVTRPTVVSAYIYNTRWKIDGTAEVIEKTSTGGQYSGYCNGYKLVSDTITINASDLAGGKKKYIKLNANGISNLKINNTTKNSDLLTIHLANANGTPVDVTATSSGQNLGNWAVIYEIPIKFVNNSGNSSVTFEIYAKTDTNEKDEFLVINSGTDTKYAHVRNESGYYNSWRCVSVDVSTTKTDTLRYVLGTNSCKDKRLVFKLG